MKFLDTNILARFIVGDVESQQPIVQKIFQDGHEQQLAYFIIPEVILELSYVLASHYGFDKKDILEAVQGILGLGFIQMLTNFQLDFEKAIRLYSNTDLSFEDCAYLQICLENKLELLTFDQKLKKEFEKCIGVSLA